MEPKEIIALIEKDEPLAANIYLNKKNYTIGAIQVYPRKISDALFKLYDEGETKLFFDDREEELFLESLKNMPPDVGEIKAFKARAIREDKSYEKFTDEQISEIMLNGYKEADKDLLLERLKVKDVRLTFALMMENFDAAFSSCMLRILSTAQMATNNEIRKELGLPLLKKREIKLKRVKIELFQ